MRESRVARRGPLPRERRVAVGRQGDRVLVRGPGPRRQDDPGPAPTRASTWSGTTRPAASASQSSSRPRSSARHARSPSTSSSATAPRPTTRRPCASPPRCSAARPRRSPARTSACRSDGAASPSPPSAASPSSPSSRSSRASSPSGRRTRRRTTSSAPSPTSSPTAGSSNRTTDPTRPSPSRSPPSARTIAARAATSSSGSSATSTAATASTASRPSRPRSPSQPNGTMLAIGDERGGRAAGAAARRSACPTAPQADLGSRVLGIEFADDERLVAGRRGQPRRRARGTRRSTRPRRSRRRTSAAWAFNRATGLIAVGGREPGDGGREPEGPHADAAALDAGCARARRDRTRLRQRRVP